MKGKYRHFRGVTEAYAFLKQLGAPVKLIRHVLLASEAVELLIDKFKQLQIPLDDHFVRLGVAFHDAGKILYPDELTAKGSYHEFAGEQLLSSYGVDPRLARCCRSHAQWQTMECSIEELLVALADTLWKGKRHSQLESALIDRVAEFSNKERWELFIEMDFCFEKIASDGEDRLLRS